MKFFAVLAATAVTVASAADCDIMKLAPVAVTGANAVACQKATTYSAATAVIPSGDLLKNVCSTKACNDLLVEMNAVVTESCTYLGKDIKTEVLDKFPAACKAALGGDATPTAKPIANCDVTKLAPVAVTSANAIACQKATTYSAATAVIPTGDVLKNVCSTQACMDLLVDMNAVVTESCMYLGKDIKSEVLDRFPAACFAASGGDATPTPTPTPPKAC